MKKFLRKLRQILGGSALATAILVTNSYATDYSKIEVRGQVTDETTTNLDSGNITKYFATGSRQMQTVSLTASAFNNLTVPSGAKAVLIDVGTSHSLKLKGVTGDTGVSLDTACPVLLPISDDPATTTLGILNSHGSAQSVKVFWF